MRCFAQQHISINKKALRKLRPEKLIFSLLILLGIVSGCSSPRYKSNITSGIDQHITYERGMDLDALILERIEKAERGLEVNVPVDDLNEAYRPLQKWIADIKDTDGEVDDKKRIIEKHSVLQREGAPDDLTKLKNRIVDKTESIFNSKARNRRLYFAKRYNLILREEKQNLLFVFLPRGDLGK